MYAIMGGLGAQGRAILRYLLLHTSETIITNDLHNKPIPPEMEAMGRVLDPKRERWIHTAGMFLNGLQQGGFEEGIVISCIDPSRNLQLARTCVEQGWSYLDLGGDTSVSLAIGNELHGSAVSRRVVLASECGLAPGIISSMAAHAPVKAANSGRRLISARFFCGGIPAAPEPPLSYALSFSPTGLIREYSGTAEFRRNNRVVNVPALSERELIFIPSLGMLEAFVTTGGLGTTPYKLGVPNLEYKTLRHPGHLDYVKQNILWQKQPDLQFAALAPPVSSAAPDLIVLMLETKAMRLTTGEVETQREVAFWRYDMDNGISAMAQATGYSAAALAVMIHDDYIKPGFLPMHEVDWPAWQTRIRAMPDQFRALP